MSKENLSAIQVPAKEIHHKLDILSTFVNGRSGDSAVISTDNVGTRTKFAWLPTWVYCEFLQPHKFDYEPDPVMLRWSGYKKVWLKSYTQHVFPNGYKFNQGEMIRV